MVACGGGGSGSAGGGSGTPVVAEGGAAVVPAVMSGDEQFGFSNVTSLMIAKSQNLPLKPIAPGVSGVSGVSGEAKAWDSLLTPEGGAMQELIDLSKQDGVLQGDVDTGTFVDLG